jgi:hypothetical protein
MRLSPSWQRLGKPQVAQDFLHHRRALDARNHLPRPAAVLAGLYINSEVLLHRKQTLNNSYFNDRSGSVFAVRCLLG